MTLPKTILNLKERHRFCNPPHKALSYLTPYIGLVALSSDHNIEGDLHFLLSDQLSLVTTRHKNDTTITSESLNALEIEIKNAIKMLGRGIHFETIVFGCTSAAVLLSHEKLQRICDAVFEHLPQPIFVTPSVAILAALNALQARRVLVFAPYTEDITYELGCFLQEANICVVELNSLGLELDRDMTAIDPTYWSDLVLDTAVRIGPCFDAILIACTSVRATTIVQKIETNLAISIVTSNLAIAWYVAKMLHVSNSSFFNKFLLAKMTT